MSAELRPPLADFHVARGGMSVVVQLDYSVGPGG